MTAAVPEQPSGQSRQPAEMDAVAVVEQVRELHRDWGTTDVADLDTLDLWERLAVILGEPV